MVTLIMGNEKIEVMEDTITYNIRINNSFNIPAVAASYTNEFVIPKTPDNTRIFQGLGLVGDTSQLPYEKTSVLVKYEGYAIIVRGWLNITETNDYYNAHVADGIVDFFKDIENKTIGKDLDLSALNHTKDLNTVANSFENNNYKYIIADYGGRTQAKVERPQDTAIDIDYLTPSVRVKFLWDKIMNTFGYEYAGKIFDSEDFTALWMTYPKEVRREGGNVEEFKGNLTINAFDLVKQPRLILREVEKNIFHFDKWNFNEFTLKGFTKINQNTFRANKTRNYRLKIKMRGYAQYKINRDFHFAPFYLRINDGKNPTRLTTGNDGKPVEIDYEKHLEQGQDITFDIVVIKENPNWNIFRIANKGLQIGVYESSFGEVNFGEALNNFTITEFVKEIIARFSIVPVLDKFEKKIIFYKIDERTDTQGAIDWTDKYVSRNKEVYMNNTYAQENIFRHKYNDPNAQYSDGSLQVSNKNLLANKNLFSSKIYSHETGHVSITPIYGAEPIKVRSYLTWQGQIKEDTNGDLGIYYKGLTGRFYFMKKKEVAQRIKLVSQELGGFPIEKQSFPLDDSLNTNFNELIPKYYKEYKRVLDDMKIQEIALTVNFMDIILLDFTKLYYFGQESNYYLLNTLIWNSDGSCVGEFIRVKKY